MKLPISAERQKSFDEAAARLIDSLRKGSGQEQEKPTARLMPARKGPRRVRKSTK